MARLTLLLTLVALALPGAALAASVATATRPRGARDRALLPVLRHQPGADRHRRAGGPGRPQRPVVARARPRIGAGARPARRRPRRLRAPARCARAASAPERRAGGGRLAPAPSAAVPTRTAGAAATADGCASARERPRTPKATRTSAIRPSPMPGIVSHHARSRTSGVLAPTEASTLTPGEPSAFIITTDHSPLRTFQSSGRPSTEEAAQNVWAAGIAGRASPACRRLVDRERVEVEVGDLVALDLVEVGVDVLACGRCRRRPAWRSRRARVDADVAEGVGGEEPVRHVAPGRRGSRWSARASARSRCAAPSSSSRRRRSCSR